MEIPLRIFTYFLSIITLQPGQDWRLLLAA